MGRPPGLRNKLTLLREKFADANAADILNMLFRHALDHPAAAIFLAKRLFPAKDWAAATATPGTGRLKSVADCDAMMEELLDAYCEGNISLEQFDRLSSLVSQRRDKQATLNSQLGSKFGPKR